MKLFNDAAVGSTMLEQAKAETVWLLKSICVDVTWISCPVVTVANLAQCGAPTNAAELHILLSPPTGDAGRNAMGLALPKAGPGGRAAVFLSRVQELESAHPGIIGTPALLGHVIAHEIGHLLLRSSVHSSEGIMRPDFRKSELLKAAQRQLRFTRGQISAIQQRMLVAAK